MKLMKKSKFNFSDNSLLAEKIRKLIWDIYCLEANNHRVKTNNSFDGHKFNKFYNKIFGFDTHDFEKIIGGVEAIKRTHPLIKYYYIDLPEKANIPSFLNFEKNQSKKYLFLIGVLNACYMQAECVKALINLFKVIDDKKYKNKFEESHSGILKVRHALGAHPIRTIGEKNVFHINSFDNDYDKLWYFTTIKGTSPTVMIKKELLKFNNLCFKCLNYLFNKIVDRIRKKNGKKYDNIINNL